ncbi:F protein [Shewanella sp. 3B26]|uniref:F protein n=1 Tax=Shewanella zhuhaiensis TaxID=2919576 RepID=A0AAJ1F0X2_9GAMM|nr:phage minor head protein [Shewanella zhuhaiensis]MCH4295581.1 F protein [Shewanella zhuhaiensis]
MPGAAAKYGSLPFAEAIAVFRQKLNMPTESWRDVWGEAHNRAFMVAGAMGESLLNDLRGAVDDAIARGVSLGEFQKQFAAIAARHGWDYTGPEPWRARVIYDTNMRQSYNAGREAQMEATKGRRPYGIYVHGDSLNPREQHLKWHYLVLPLDDPWWQTHSPSNGYGCKCKKYSLSAAELQRRGLTVSSSPAIEYRDYLDKATGEIRQIPRGIDPGFEYRPGNLEDANKTLQSSLQAKATFSTKPRAATEPRVAKAPAAAPRTSSPRMVDSVFSSVKGVEAKGLSQLLEQLAPEPKALLAQYIQSRGAKTLFVKQTEMGSGVAGNKIADEVAAYLSIDKAQARYMYYSRHARRTNGFTAKHWQHVVVKSPASASFKKVKMETLATAAADALQAAQLGAPLWSISTRAQTLGGDSARVLATWAHEIGHQVHFHGGETALAEFGYVSQYAKSNNYETFAEWFACFLFAPDAVKAHNPVLYQAIVQTVQHASGIREQKN